MSDDGDKVQAAAEDQFLERMQALEPSTRQRVLRKLIGAALGSIPWVGGFLTASIAFNEESRQLETNALQRQWLAEHKQRMEQLARDLSALVSRLESFGEEISERLESESYLALVRKAFRIWDESDTEEKRVYIGRLLANAGGTKLCDDDLIRLFLDWLERYHEAHFKVIREIYQNPESTRADIWANIHGDFPVDNSSEADLFKLLINDLSQGHIVRQKRETNSQGQFLRKRRRTVRAGSVLKSPFDDSEPYELTELGQKFVHYTFSDVVKRIDTGGGPL